MEPSGDVAPRWVGVSRPNRGGGGRADPPPRPTLTPTVPTAVLAFDFDPLLHLGDGAVRWETVAIAAAIFAAIALTGLSAASAGLRVDDLLFVVLGIVPGAVVGGRVGYVLLHPSFFTAVPGRILDPGLGSLELTLAVVGGALTGCLVALLLDGRPGPWLRVATFPTLLVLAAGKLAMVLGGSGQGAPTSGEPATAYLGTGPWGSLGPAIPSIPAQAIEGLAGIGLVVLVGLVSLVPGLRRADARLFLLAVGLWAAMRAIVASTWRDPVVLGPLRAEQAIDLVVAVGAVGLAFVVIAVRRGGRDDATERSTDEAGFGERGDPRRIG
jgi:phosphatidylglycerol:prolipoprotein diacylglycerol transferase